MGIENLKNITERLNVKKYMVVCGKSFHYSGFEQDVINLGVPYVIFNGFTVNPLHKDVDKGVELLKKECCDAILAIGGGSAIDVAKCIKLDGDFSVPLIAIPTTAGTGSESTRHIVVYKDDKKQSISDERIIPDFAILDAKGLKTLPDYQKKCALLDALCQAIESRWCNLATSDSVYNAETAIKMIMANKDAYINEGDERASENILLASNYAGRAINVTATTSAHAMSYKLSAVYGIPHGYAVAISLPYIWEEMLKIADDNIRLRFNSIANALGTATVEEGIEVIKNILKEFCMNKLPNIDRKIDLEEFVCSVNPERLKNNPVPFTKEQIEMLYKKVLGWDC